MVNTAFLCVAGQMERYLIFYAEVISGRDIKCVAETSKILNHCSWHIPMLRIGDAWGNMQLNESGKQKAGS